MTPEKIPQMDEDEFRRFAEEETRGLREWAQHEERRKRYEEMVKFDEEYYSARQCHHAPQTSPAAIWATRRSQPCTPWPASGELSVFAIYESRKSNSLKGDER
jgi:hypothetical protein